MAAREYSLSEVADALRHIDCNDRATWVRMALALKSTFGEDGFEAWDDWSQDGATYNQRAARNVWKSAKAGKTTVGSLIHEAKAQGWRPGPRQELTADQQAERARRRAARDAMLVREAKELVQYQSLVADHAAAVWEQLAPTGSSRYLGAKAVGAHGIRFGREPLLSVVHLDRIAAEIITGQAPIRAFLEHANTIPKEEWPFSFKHIKRGCIAVPLRDIDGVIWNLQMIWPTGKKTFFKNGRKSGCFHVLGSIKPAARLVVTEGYATGATIHELTGCPVVVALDAGQLLPVCLALRGRYPDADMLIAADNDANTEGNPGVTSARAAAVAVRARLAVPTFEQVAA